MKTKETLSTVSETASSGSNSSTIKKAHQIMAESETGGRTPLGWPSLVLLGVAMIWSLFQIWYASPLPFMFNFGVFNDTEARSIHLAFSIFLVYLAFPAMRNSPHTNIPLQDWLFAAAGAFCTGYIFLFYRELSDRPGLPTDLDMVVAITGMILLLEGTRRALGPPLMVVASVFLLYTYAGPFMPEVIAHKGQSLNKIVSHQWLGTEGVFGVALGVSTSFVFLFVLFGSLLERAGAGNYFIKVAFSLLGHMRGGPAKAAVVSSGMTGLISGSSIANVVTTGTFTIPLMKRVGFPDYKAGAVEVAASTNGQLTPPIMGAAAFLMVEYVGISYLEVITHAFLPAIISYIALVYIVHLEALKANMQGLPRKYKRSLAQTMLGFFSGIIAVMVITAVVYYGIGWLKLFFPDTAVWIVALLAIIIYILLLRYASRFPELEPDDPEETIAHLPEPGPTIKSGLYYLLPLVMLVWCLTVERFSPGLSAFWATVFMIFIVITQRPLQAFFRAETNLKKAMWRGFYELIEGLVSGARNMIGIGVATAAAGIIVGTVTLTGIGLVMTEFVEFISGGNLMLMLLFTALISLVLGMGLPTTANYIVVSTLMAPVIVTLGAQNGLIVPLIAVHMFVFYFGILADDTPPVGLAAFAASAIAQSDPIKTGIQGFTYDIRTAILPFLFIFNTELLMIGIESWWHLLLTIVTAILAMLLFAAATQGFFFVRNRWWETIILLLISFTLFRPGFWWEMAFPSNSIVEPTKIVEIAEQIPENHKLQLHVEGENLDGDLISKMVVLPMGDIASGKKRLETAGLEFREEKDRVFVDMVVFDSLAQKAGIDFDWEILSVQVPTDQPPKQWMYLPAILLLALVIVGQRQRKTVSS
ncbi:MAG: C4-dicarboxylate TRAP transporter large permease protein DctM [Deltaproteobacteria bacterium]|jgi:TRAP transporter 4TM/12TM fusion protein|nr:C4-dicarboxylate TRAP transporter large permease protein DctM [Deltaproteobacteria bacterium]